MVFAAALWIRPHILVLDEPTNFLDHDSLSALSAAIADFKGGVVLISHHDQFTRGLTTEKWVMDSGALVGHGMAATTKQRKPPVTAVGPSTGTAERERLSFKEKKEKKLTRHELKEREVRRRLRHLEWLSSPKGTPKPEDTDDE